MSQSYACKESGASASGIRGSGSRSGGQVHKLLILSLVDLPRDLLECTPLVAHENHA